MHVSAREHEAILKAFRGGDPAARVCFFGSRTDDEKRGGDIDLRAESDVLIPADTRGIRLRIMDATGEQKIDIVSARGTTSPRNAREAGSRICRS